MKKLVKVACASVVLSWGALAQAAASKMSADDVIKKVQERKVPDSSEAEVEMAIKKGGDSAIKIFRSSNLKVSDQEGYSLIEFLKPVTTKILVLTHGKDKEEDRWVKTSGGQPRRIATGSGDQTFMQSHFSYEDLEVGRAKDVTNELICTGDVCTVDLAGAPHYKIKSVTKQGSTYAYQISYVRESDYFVNKIEYYGKNEKKLKELTIDETKTVDGFLIPMLVTMKMADNGDSTVIKTVSVTVNPKNLKKQKFDKNLL